MPVVGTEEWIFDPVDFFEPDRFNFSDSFGRHILMGISPGNVGKIDRIGQAEVVRPETCGELRERLPDHVFEDRLTFCAVLSLLIREKIKGARLIRDVGSNALFVRTERDLFIVIVSFAWSIDHKGRVWNITAQEYTPDRPIERYTRIFY